MALGKLAAAAALAVFAAASPAGAQVQTEYLWLVGSWRCSMNSVPATVEMLVALGPEHTLIAQGTLILNGTSGYHQFMMAGGRWLVGRDEFGQTVVQMQVMPQNYASFSIYPAITSDRNILYGRVPVPGGYVESACRRSTS